MYPYFVQLITYQLPCDANGDAFRLPVLGRLQVSHDR
jgi:hypothetical protein